MYMHYSFLFISQKTLQNQNKSSVTQTRPSIWPRYQKMYLLYTLAMLIFLLRTGTPSNSYIKKKKKKKRKCLLALRPLNTRPWAPPEVTGQCLEEQKRNHIDKHPSNKTNVLIYIWPKKYRHEICQIIFCNYSFCGQTFTHDSIICNLLKKCAQ